MDYKSKEKAILSPRMAAFLVLNGCKINSAKADIKGSTNYVYFFQIDDKLNFFMNEYSNFWIVIDRLHKESHKRFINHNEKGERNG